MSPENEVSLNRSVRECLEKISYAQKLAEPVAEQIRAGKLEADYLDRVQKFMENFSEVQQSIEELPIEDGKITVPLDPAEKRETAELLPKLITRVEELAAYQALIIETLQKQIETSNKSMKDLRDAKQIFNKFVKKPEKGPVFFDRKG